MNRWLARDGHAGKFEVQKLRIAHGCRGRLLGLFRICQRFIPEMVKQKRGSIINISSIYGVVANDPSIYVGTDLVPSPLVTHL